MPRSAKRKAMDAPLTKPWTTEEFLTWAETQDERYEFDGNTPVAMTGGSYNHAQIKANITFVLRTKLKGTGCRSWLDGLAVPTIKGKIRFPDTLIICNPPSDFKSRIAPNPVIVFEIVSPSTVHEDHHVKLLEYAAVASIRAYIIIESASVKVTARHRASPHDEWRLAVHTAGDTLPLAAAGIEITVDSLYEDTVID